MHFLVRKFSTSTIRIMSIGSLCIHISILINGEPGYETLQAHRMKTNIDNDR